MLAQADLITVTPKLYCSVNQTHCSTTFKVKEHVILKNNEQYGCAVGDGVACQLSTNNDYVRTVRIADAGNCNYSYYTLTGSPFFVPTNVNHTATWIMGNPVWICDAPITGPARGSGCGSIE